MKGHHPFERAISAYGHRESAGPRFRRTSQSHKRKCKSPRPSSAVKHNDRHYMSPRRVKRCREARNEKTVLCRGQAILGNVLIAIAGLAIGWVAFHGIAAGNDPKLPPASAGGVAIVITTVYTLFGIGYTQGCPARARLIYAITYIALPVAWLAVGFASG